MKSLTIAVILCTICLITAFSAGCTSQSNATTPAATAAPQVKPPSAPVSPAASAVPTKPAVAMTETPSPGGYYLFDDSMNGYYYAVPKGSDILVSLPESPSTDFAWELIADPAGLTKTRDEYVAPSSSSTLAGGSGNHEWEFKASTPGDYTIKGTLRSKTGPLTGYETIYMAYVNVEK
jgi:predicted secreted protein